MVGRVRQRCTDLEKDLGTEPRTNRSIRVTIAGPGVWSRGLAEHFHQDHMAYGLVTTTAYLHSSHSLPCFMAFGNSLEGSVI